MAIAATTNATAYGQQNSVTLSSVFGAWTTVCTDAQATAATVGERKAPLTYAATNCRWVRVPSGCSRMALRIRYEGTAVTTNPEVYVYGAFPADNTVPDATSGQFATGGTVPISRLDNTMAGTALTIAAVVATDISDGTYQSSTPVGFTNPFTNGYGDLGGARYVLVLCSTAAVVTGGNDTCIVEAMFL